jgi:hypothetical protein
MVTTRTNQSKLEPTIIIPHSTKVISNKVEGIFRTGHTIKCNNNLDSRDKACNRMIQVQHIDHNNNHHHINRIRGCKEVFHRIVVVLLNNRICPDNHHLIIIKETISLQINKAHNHTTAQDHRGNRRKEVKVDFLNRRHQLGISINIRAIHSIEVSKLKEFNPLTLVLTLIILKIQPPIKIMLILKRLLRGTTKITINQHMELEVVLEEVLEEVLEVVLEVEHTNLVTMGTINLSTQWVDLIHNTTTPSPSTKAKVKVNSRIGSHLRTTRTTPTVTKVAVAENDGFESR